MAINKIVFWKKPNWKKKALKNRDDPRSFRELESVIKNVFLWDVELEVRGAKSQRRQLRESTDLMGSVRAAVSSVLHVGNVLGVDFVCNNSLDSSTCFSVYKQTIILCIKFLFIYISRGNIFLYYLVWF